jgi:hypothetical protein
MCEWLGKPGTTVHETTAAKGEPMDSRLGNLVKHTFSTPVEELCSIPNKVFRDVCEFFDLVGHDDRGQGFGIEEWKTTAVGYIIGSSEDRINY